MKKYQMMTGILGMLFALAPNMLLQAHAFDFKSVTYTIPADQSLYEELTLGVAYAKLWREKGDKVNLSFKLPPELTGINGKTFRLSGTQLENQILMTGRDVDAHCLIAEERTDCVMTFRALSLNHSAAYNYMEGDPAFTELKDLIQAGRESLEHQAVGILSFHHGL